VPTLFQNSICPGVKASCQPDTAVAVPSFDLLSSLDLPALSTAKEATSSQQLHNQIDSDLRGVSAATHPRTWPAASLADVAMQQAHSTALSAPNFDLLGFLEQPSMQEVAIVCCFLSKSASPAEADATDT
jgi:hypothetical protein